MAKVEFKGLVRVTAKGRVYWYAWRGGPRILAKPGTPEFAAEFAAHHGIDGLAPVLASEPTAEEDDGSWGAYDRLHGS